MKGRRGWSPGAAGGPRAIGALALMVLGNATLHPPSTKRAALPDCLAQVAGTLPIRTKSV